MTKLVADHHEKIEIDRFRRDTQLLWAGVIAPSIFAAICVLDSSTRPHYDQLVANVSALSLGPRGWLGTTNLLLAGALTLVFGVAVAHALPKTRRNRWAVGLICFAGVGWAGGGIFSQDPGGGYPPGESTTHASLHNSLHDMSAVLVLAAITVVPLILRSLAGRGWRAYCIVTSAVVVAAISVSSTLEAYDFGGIHHYRAPGGLLERVALGVGFFWFAGLAVMLRRQIDRIS